MPDARRATPTGSTPRPTARRALAAATAGVLTVGLGIVAVGALGQSANAASSYDTAVLADQPTGYWALDGGTADLSGTGHNGSYVGQAPTTTTLPNGERASTFSGTGTYPSLQYFSVPSSSAFSISTTKKLTWEGWIRPDTLQFPSAPDGYVDWMGKCQEYSPSCEWEGRMYSASNSEDRTSRLSAYAFNPSAGLGSGAAWQGTGQQFTAGGWIHVVGEYDLTSTPADCSASHPGTIGIWVDGVKQNFDAHAPTGCMSQYSVAPKAGISPLNIGTVALDSWFKGAIGKVAVYDHLLSTTAIAEHYRAMTGTNPSGTCGDTCVLYTQPGGSPTGQPTAASTTPAPSSTTTSAAPVPATTATTPVASPTASATTTTTRRSKHRSPSYRR